MAVFSYRYEDRLEDVICLYKDITKLNCEFSNLIKHPTVKDCEKIYKLAKNISYNINSLEVSISEDFRAKWIDKTQYNFLSLLFSEAKSLFKLIEQGDVKYGD